MLPRERVMMALNHQQPDRVPIEFHGTVEVMIKMMQYFHLDPSDFGASWSKVGKKLHADLVDMFYAPYIGPELKKFDDGTYLDDKGRHWKKVKNDSCEYDGYASFPLEYCGTAEDLEKFNWFSAENYDYDALVTNCRAAHDYYAVRARLGAPFEVAWGLRGLEQFLIVMAISPEIAHFILGKITDFYCDYVDRLMAAGGADCIDIIFTHDDIASQQSMLMSTAMWEEFIKPCHAKINKKIHEYGIKVHYHSCGNIWNEDIIEGLIDIGVDILNPLQMCGAWSFEYVKETYGDRLCFNGGIGLQTALSVQSPDEVKKEVRRVIDIMNQNGGYIFMGAHFIQDDTPVENIIAMYEEASGEKIAEE